MSLESDGGMILAGENERTWRKPSLSATLSDLMQYISQFTEIFVCDIMYSHKDKL
jgi:hypothetical protein